MNTEETKKNELLLCISLDHCAARSNIVLRLNKIILRGWTLFVALFPVLALVRVGVVKHSSLSDCRVSMNDVELYYLRREKMLDMFLRISVWPHAAREDCTDASFWKVLFPRRSKVRHQWLPVRAHFEVWSAFTHFIFGLRPCPHPENKLLLKSIFAGTKIHLTHSFEQKICDYLCC